MRLQKKQEKQAKNLQAAKRQHKKDKADLRDTIRLTPDAKLTSRQKRRLSASVQKAKRDGKIPRTAQQTIPYREMCRNGICVVSERFFTKQVQFYDINYQLAQNEDKNLIFENWCDFLNYFDSSIRVQFSFLNQPADMEEQHQRPRRQGHGGDAQEQYDGSDGQDRGQGFPDLFQQLGIDTHRRLLSRPGGRVGFHVNAYFTGFFPACTVFFAF